MIETGTSHESQPQPQPAETQPAPTAPAAAATASPASSTAAPQASDRRFAVGAAIALAALLFLLTAGVLYFRWATMREPTCVLIVEAPTTLRGAEVIVDGLGIAPEAHKVVVGLGERFAIPFYLDYGTYRVRVTMYETLLLDEEFTLTREAPGRRLELWKLPLTVPPVPSTAPAPSPPAPAFIPPAAETDDLQRLTPPSGGGRLSP